MTIVLELLRRFWPYIVAFTVGFSMAWGVAWKIQGIRLDSAKNDLISLETSIKVATEQAKIEKEKVEQERDANLVKVETYEKSLPAVRSNAVAAYKLRYPNVCRSSLPKPAPGKQVDERASPEPVATGFIEDSADDTNKLAAWQAWAELNGIPTKD